MALKCEKASHLENWVIALCTQKECQSESRLCCGLCILENHSTHVDNYVIKLEKLEKQYKVNNHPILSLINDFKKKVNQILNEIEREILKVFPFFPQQINFIEIKKYANKLAQDGIIISAQIEDSLLQCSQNTLSTLDEFLKSIKKENDQEYIEKKEEYNEQEQKQQFEKKKVQAGKLKQAGFDYMENQQYKEALEQFDHSIQIYDQDDDCWNNKGYVLKLLKKYEEAIVCYDQAILLNPKISLYYYNKGICLIQLNQLSQALENLDESLRLDSTDAYSWGYKGITLEKMNRIEEAMDCLLKSVEISSIELMCYHLAQILEKLDKKDQALFCYQQILENYPDSQKAKIKINELVEEMNQQV